MNNIISFTECSKSLDIFLNQTDLKKEQRDEISRLKEQIILLNQSLLERNDFTKDTAIYYYFSIKSSFDALEISQKYFYLNKKYFTNINNTNNKFYIIARKFIRLSLYLLTNVFPFSKVVDYNKSQAVYTKIPEFTYARQLNFIRAFRETLSYLIEGQKDTRFFMLNWDIRFEAFFLLKNSLDYKNLLKINILDPFFNDKKEIIDILILWYEDIILALKKDYEVTKQVFFFEKAFFILQDYKTLCVLLRKPEIVEWANKQIAGLDRELKRRKT